jgi:polysaccharide export outer membrane protein
MMSIILCRRRGAMGPSLAMVLASLLLTGAHAQERSQAGSAAQGRTLELPAMETEIAPSGTPDQVSPEPWTRGRYRLTPSDVVELRFPYVPEFDQTVTVHPDGYISLRGLGDLRVQGRTLPELKALLHEVYVDILREPVITIVLKEFEKPYFIAAGEVARPGKYELRGATTLTQGMVLAGGQTAVAKHSQVLLFRRFSAEWLEVKEVNVKKMYANRNMAEDPLLRPGDTIFIPKSLLSKIAPFIPRPGLGLYLNPF